MSNILFLLLWKAGHVSECVGVLWDLSQVEEGDRETRICPVGPPLLPSVEELYISDLSIA